MRLGLEQGLGELGGRTATVFPGLDQGLESLELVQNDQVRLQGADADLRQQPPQFADQLIAPPSGLVRPVTPVAMERVVEEVVQLELQVVPLLEFLIEIPSNCGFDGELRFEPSTPAIFLGHPPLQEVHQRRQTVDVRSQEMKQNLPLPAPAAGMAHLERRAWREADEIQLVFHETRPVVCRCQLGGQHGETGCQRERSLAGAPNLELREIGASDAGVAADVDDVDPIHVFPEVIDGSGDDPARDQRLPQADLVGNEEAGRTVRIQEQAAESVIDGAALERL